MIIHGCLKKSLSEYFVIKNNNIIMCLNGLIMDGLEGEYTIVYEDESL